MPQRLRGAVLRFITGYQNAVHRGTIAQVRRDASFETNGMLSCAAIEKEFAISYLDRILTCEAVASLLWPSRKKPPLLCACRGQEVQIPLPLNSRYTISVFGTWTAPKISGERATPFVFCNTGRRRSSSESRSRHTCIHLQEEPFRSEACNRLQP